MILDFVEGIVGLDASLRVHVEVDPPRRCDGNGTVEALVQAEVPSSRLDRDRLALEDLVHPVNGEILVGDALFERFLDKTLDLSSFGLVRQLKCTLSGFLEFANVLAFEITVAGDRMESHNLEATSVRHRWCSILVLLTDLTHCRVCSLAALSCRLCLFPSRDEDIIDIDRDVIDSLRRWVSG
jgi:hypothetical protein